MTAIEAKEWLDLIPTLSGWGFLVLLILYVGIFPDQFQKNLEFIFKGFEKLKIFGVWANKKKITYGIQGRINHYVNNYLSEEIKDFVGSNIKIEWVDENQTEENFRKNGKLIVRMRRNDNENKNFVNASMVFISENLLKKAKLYISRKQQESVDLYVAKKLFETEKEEVLIQFIADFFQKRNDDKRVGEFLEQYNRIDKAALFFPVFIQEMTFLGEKAFGSSFPKNKVFEEVNGLIDFLFVWAKRKSNESINNIFTGQFCKFGVMIVGNKSKIKNEGKSPYKKHIKFLLKKGVETIYLIGAVKQENFIKSLCLDNFLKTNKLSLLNNKKYEAITFDKNGKEIKSKTYLTVLRKYEIEHYFSNI